MHVKELFGISTAETRNPNLAKAYCPFMEDTCDGGGNRHMADVTLSEETNSVRSAFDHGVIRQGVVACGICSIGDRSTWIVCPRRLLTFTSNGFSKTQKNIVDALYKIGNFAVGDAIEILYEVKVSNKSKDSQFNYTFDYVMRGANTSKFLIVEVMTSSTSGGSKSKGTDIQVAFRKAIMNVGSGEKTPSPGTNIRQVWARMASQMIVKSQAGLKWNGRTVWVIEKNLADYVQKSTGLDLNGMSSEPDEVNILIVDPASGDVRLAACPINGSGDHHVRALDILLAPMIPDRDVFDKSLNRKEPIVKYTIM